MSSFNPHRRIHHLVQHLQPSSQQSILMSSDATLTPQPTAASSGPFAVNIAVSTHVLNTATGQPAANMLVYFEHHAGGDKWTRLGEGRTNADGRIGTFPPIQTNEETADYRLIFQSGEYLKAEGHPAPFFPQITLQWQVNKKADKDRAKLHVPLLLSPFGFSSYRGS